MYSTLISAADLAPHVGDTDWAIIDCRFSLADTERGRVAYQEAHIPGALYAHLDEDLSGLITPGKTGRHPLPPVDTFAQTLSTWGIDASIQVIGYDDFGGAIASRLWWMLRWLGHDAIAVLNGGWPAWLGNSLPTSSNKEKRTPRTFSPQSRPEMIADVEEVATLHKDPTSCLIDARAAARYRGDHEPIDPIAGHIPGAMSAPFADNLDADGFFLSPEKLRTRFESVLEDHSPEQAVSYCGSGVTGAHNLLALAHAGLDGARLYPGSWSHWITDPNRPIATR